LSSLTITITTQVAIEHTRGSGNTNPVGLTADPSICITITISYYYSDDAWNVFNYILPSHLLNRYIANIYFVYRPCLTS